MRTTHTLGALILALAGVTTVLAGQARTVPAGTQLDFMLQTAINTAKFKVDQRFDATLVDKVELQGQVVLSAGLGVRGFVALLKPVSAETRQGQVILAFEEIQAPAGGALKLRATVLSVLDPRRSDQMARPGVGTAAPGRSGNGTGVGIAPFGAVFVADGGRITATTATDVNLPIGIVLRVRLDQPIEVPAAR